MITTLLKNKKHSLTCAALLLAGGFGYSAHAAATTPNPGLKYYYPAPEAPVVSVEADVIVYGGTSGGVTAAVQAAREGKSVALAVFGRHVGGLTSGGLSSTDGVTALHQGGITREFFDVVGDRNFRPSTAEAEFERMLANPIPGDANAKPIPTYYEQRLKSVEKKGNRITALVMENGSVFRGRIFIDATYEGDLLAKAGVSYTFGREPRSQYNESMAGKIRAVTLDIDPYVEEGNPQSGMIATLIDEPVGELGEGDEHLQAFNFRMFTVESENPDAIQPIFKPATYDPKQFELLYRYHRGGGKTSMKVENDVNNHEMFAREVSTDHMGGNRWPDGNGGYISWADADYETREKMYQDHVAWQLGMLWYVQNDPRYAALATDPNVAPEIRENIAKLIERMQRVGFAAGEFPETGGFTHELYVREARRMLSDYVVTEADYRRRVVQPDIMAIANYRSDSHHVRRIPSPDGKSILVEGDTGGGKVAPWTIPYRSLVPKKDECDNLYVIWAVSSSHVAFRSLRMEPVLMVLGQSAATAAAMVIDQDIAVQDLNYKPLKKKLLADGQILEPAPFKKGRQGERHDESGSADATYTTEIRKEGNFRIQIKWPESASAQKVPVQVHHASGIENLVIDLPAGDSRWEQIGTWRFAKGKPGAKIVFTGAAARDAISPESVFFESVR